MMRLDVMMKKNNKKIYKKLTGKNQENPIKSSPETVTLPWWRGLRVPRIRELCCLEPCAPGRVSHDKLVSGEGPDEEWFRVAR